MTFNFKAQATWFYRIVVNCSWDILRNKKRTRRLIADPVKDQKGGELEAVEGEQLPDKLLLRSELQEQLDLSIEKLSEKQKKCFILKYKSNLNTLEIAAILKCNSSTVKVHLFRAVKKLQEDLLPYIKRGDRNV